MKRIISLVVVAAMMIMGASLFVNAAELPPVKVTLDGEYVDCAAYGQEPVIVDGRTLVPLRAIFESLGASVEWYEPTRTVTSELNGTVIKLTIGEKKLYKNGQEVALDVPAQIMNSRTLVPVRAISESFGIFVDWDNLTRTVILNTKPVYEKTQDSIPENEENVPEEAKKVLKACLDAAADFNITEAAKYSTNAEAVASLNMSGYEDLLFAMGFDKESLTEIFLDTLASGEEDYRVFCGAVADVFIDLVYGVAEKIDYEIVSYKVLSSDVIKFEVALYLPETITIEESVGIIFEKAMEKANAELVGMGDALNGKSQKDLLDILAALFKKHANPLVDETVKNLKSVNHGETTEGMLVNVDGTWLVEFDEQDAVLFEELKLEIFG